HRSREVGGPSHGVGEPPQVRWRLGRHAAAVDARRRGATGSRSGQPPGARHTPQLALGTVFYRGARQKRLTLGRYPAVSWFDARELARADVQNLFTRWTTWLPDPYENGVITSVAA